MYGFDIRGPVLEKREVGAGPADILVDRLDGVIVVLILLYVKRHLGVLRQTNERIYSICPRFDTRVSRFAAIGSRLALVARTVSAGSNVNMRDSVLFTGRRRLFCSFIVLTYFKSCPYLAIGCKIWYGESLVQKLSIQRPLLVRSGRAGFIWCRCKTVHVIYAGMITHSCGEGFSLVRAKA